MSNSCLDTLTRIGEAGPSEGGLVSGGKWRSIDAFPLYPKALLLRAQAQLDFGQYPEAAILASKALAADSKVKDEYPLGERQLEIRSDFLIRAEALLSIAYHFMGSERESKRHLARLERLDASQEKFVWKAQVAMASGRDADALRAFQDLQAWRTEQLITNVIDITGLVAGLTRAAGHVLYLGEINSSQELAWRKSIEVLDEGSQGPRTLALFAEDRCEGLIGDESIVRLKLSQLRLCRPRQWGACWLALTLWRELGLDQFWAERLAPGRKGTRWDQVLLVLVVYRLIAPGSEWRLHREWYERSALGDLLGADSALAELRASSFLTAAVLQRPSLLRAVRRRSSVAG